MILQLRPLIGKFNDACRVALEGAAALASSRTHDAVLVEHLLVKLLEQQQSDVHYICRRFAVDITRAQREAARDLDKLTTGSRRMPALDPELVKLLQDAWLIASVNLSALEVRTGHLLIAMAERPRIPPALSSIDWPLLEAEFDSIVETSREAVPSVDEIRSQEPTRGPKRHAIEPRVFISYRRTDYPLMVDALFNRFLASGCQVFRDTNTLRLGTVFRDAIRDTITSCDALVAVIGTGWDGSAPGLPRRIDDPNDFVRIEVETALELKKHVIPCLVAGVAAPSSESLPESLRALAERHAVVLSDSRFQQDTEVLINSLRAMISY
jgi:hypothetical protein